MGSLPRSPVSTPHLQPPTRFHCSSDYHVVENAQSFLSGSAGGSGHRKGQGPSEPRASQPGLIPSTTLGGKGSEHTAQPTVQRARPGSHSFSFTRTADAMGIYPETIAPSFSCTRTPFCLAAVPGVTRGSGLQRVKICTHGRDSLKQVLSLLKQPRGHPALGFMTPRSLPWSPALFR